MQLAEEVAIAISINELNYAVMLASPYDIEDFVIGFLLSELIIKSHIEVHDICITEQNEHLVANVKIANRRSIQLSEKMRHIKGTSGCGLCGKQALEQAFPALNKLNDSAPINIASIESLKLDLKKWQTRAKKTGALHAAFWLDSKSNIIACREDIGRHNALDKLLGYANKQQFEKTGAAVLLTSRASVELIQKAINANIPNLICLASPSQLAVNVAIAHNLNLIHIPQYDDPVVYSGVV